MPAPTRRSVRKRKANTKYLGTGWDKNALRLLRESSESSGSSPSEDSGKEDQSVDQDFAGQIIADAEAVSSSEDEDVSDVSSGAAIGTPLGSDEDTWSVTSRDVGTPRGKDHRPSANVAIAGAPTDIDPGRSRGIAPVYRTSSSFSQIFGPDDYLKPLLHARDIWLQDRDRTLPSRKTLAARLSLSNETTDLTANVDNEEDHVNIAARQELELIDLASGEAARYLIADAAYQSVALGPVGQQKLFKAEYLKPLDATQAWPQAAKPPVEERMSDADPDPSTSVQESAGAWIINVGEKIQSLAWLPGNDKDAQFLAVACRSTSNQRNAVATTPTTRSPAFYPSANYPSCIQLWAFPTTDDRNSTPPKLSVPAVRLPELCIAYALDAGDVRQLQWQPSTTFKHLKLLAVLSTDGCVRILALNPAYFGGKPPACIRVKTAPMQIQSPPDTVFTTICWASTSDLILGASDGTLHIYNIQDHASPTSYLSIPLHNTYIMSIVSTFPSSTPTFIASTSAAGDLLLTDLRAPEQDQVHVPKARLPTKPLVYCPHTRFFLTVTDTTGISEPRHTASLVQCHNLRHFYRSRQICKLPAMSGAATALAGSPHHPCILVGNAKGSVFATNYLHRALPGEGGTREGDGYLQTVYEYDWRPMTTAEQEANADDGAGGKGRDREDRNPPNPRDPTDLFHGHDVRPGISRFTEDFPPETVDMNTEKTETPRRKRKHSPSSRRQKADKAAEDAARYGFDVIFEEEQAVTCIEWNPNLPFAGWAAVGWGSGILRVEDLSHDGE